MRIGDVVAGRFVIESAAASGGMGRIFRAVDRDTGAPAAVKVLLPCGEQEVARFAREAELLEAMRHPRVVRALAHGATEGGEPYLVMEWLDGEDLGQRLARGPLSIGETVAIARYVAEALGAAHARGIVHRDVKPSNLFLVGGAIDRVKVLDFGVARLTGQSTRLTRTGTIVGTIGYMAPEQARGGGHADARADVFALGAVMFECLTGAPPFDADDLAPLLAKLLFEEAPRAQARRARGARRARRRDARQGAERAAARRRRGRGSARRAARGGRGARAFRSAARARAHQRRAPQRLARARGGAAARGRRGHAADRSSGRRRRGPAATRGALRRAARGARRWIGRRHAGRRRRGHRSGGARRAARDRVARSGGAARAARDRGGHRPRRDHREAARGRRARSRRAPFERARSCARRRDRDPARRRDREPARRALRRARD